MNLGSPVGQSPLAGVGAEGMSGNGNHIAGYSVWVPYVWDRGTGMRALLLGPGDQLAQANDVNDTGVAVGSSGTLLGGEQAATWDLAGAIRFIHRPAWTASWAVGLTNAGLVLVQARVPVGSVTQYRVFAGPLAGPLVDLAPSSSLTMAYDINERGQVCMHVGGAPRRYTPGIGLELVGPFQPQRINDLGQMAGVDETTGNVVRYTDGLGWQALGVAPVGGFRDIGGIDSFGRIVASEYVRVGNSPPTYTQHGHLFVNGLGRLKLDDLIDGVQQVRVGTVVGITDTGAIACWGSIGPDNRALLLEPRFISVYGQSCSGGSGRLPKAIASGTPTAGQRIALLGAGGVPNGTAAFVLAARPAAVTLPGGCTLHVDPTTGFAMGAATNAAGQASLALQLPVSTPPGAVHMQFVTLDAGAANGVFALSNGVRIDVQ